MPADLEGTQNWLSRIEEKLDRHFENQNVFECEMRSRMAHLEEKEQKTDQDCRKGINDLQMLINKMNDKIQIIQSCNDRQEILMDWLKRMLTGALITGIAALMWAIIGHIAPNILPGNK